MSMKNWFKAYFDNMTNNPPVPTGAPDDAWIKTIIETMCDDITREIAAVANAARIQPGEESPVLYIDETDIQEAYIRAYEDCVYMLEHPSTSNSRLINNIDSYFSSLTYGYFKTESGGEMSVKTLLTTMCNYLDANGSGMTQAEANEYAAQQCASIVSHFFYGYI